MLTKSTNYIVSFNPFHEPQQELVGQRAYQHWRLLQAGISMADGFVVTSLAMADFFTAANLYEKIGNVVLSLNSENADEVLGQIHEMILGANFPQMILAPILQAYRQLGGFSTKPVELRSSTGEEIALQQEAYTVNSEAKLVFAIKSIWAESFTLENILALKRQFAGASLPLLSVMVCRLTQAEASGEAFFPSLRLNNEQTQAEVIATLGNFQQASDQFDTFEVDVEAALVTSRTIMPQDKMILWQKQGADFNEQEISISSQWQTEPKISNDLAVEIAKMCQRVKETAGWDSAHILWSTSAGKTIINFAEDLPARELPATDLQDEVTKILPPLGFTIEQATKPINYQSLLEDVQQLAAEILPSENSQMLVEAEATAAPPLEELRTTVALHASQLSSSQLSNMDTYSAVFYDAKYMLARHRTLPEEIADQQSVYKELVNTYAEDVSVLSNAAGTKSIYYKFSTIDDDNLPLIRSSNHDRALLKDLSRLLQNPVALFAEATAINKVRFKNQSSNFRLIIPKLRNKKELEEAKKLLSSEGIKRMRTLQIWGELALPVFLHTLSEIEADDLDGIYVDLPQLTKRLVDSQHPTKADWELAINALVSGLEERSIPLAVNMPTDTELLQELAATNLNIQTIVVNTPASNHFWETLKQIDWTLPTLRVRKSRGRPQKSLF